jgi:hypothetical protein
MIIKIMGTIEILMNIAMKPLIIFCMVEAAYLMWIWIHLVRCCAY